MAALLLAIASRPASAQAVTLADADLLYCEHVYGEFAAAAGKAGGDAADAARDALERWRPLSERDYDLLNDSPGRHSRASAVALQRLSALPQGAGRARNLALRAAYEECRRLEAGGASVEPAAGSSDRVPMLARRRFCRDLLLRKLQVSPALRAALTPSELEVLDETRRIGDALAQPLPGAPPTQEQDHAASQLVARMRTELDQAVANRGDGPDPVVQAMAQCHDDYVQGLLGGPDVLSEPADATPAPAASTAPAPDAPAASAPVVRPASLGPVFHMRESTPAGTVDGIWFRRGRSGLYDGVWVQAENGQMLRDVLELRGIVDGELTVYRQGYHGSYRARVRDDGTLAPGTASWFDTPAYAWGPLPAQSLRRGDGGAIVHMREVTPRGTYEGLWRARGNTGIYDVLWVFLPTGELSSDVLAVTGVVRGELVIRRLDGPGLFAVKRRPPARAGTTPSRWELLPAQSLRLGRGSR